MSTPPTVEPTITTGYGQQPDGTWRVLLAVSGLPNEGAAKAAEEHLIHLFCGAQIQQEQMQ